MTAKERRHAYYLAHKEKWQSEYGPRAKAQARKDMDRLRAQWKAARQRHVEKQRQYQRWYRTTHAEAIRTKAKTKYHANREAAQAKMRAIYWADPEKARQRVRNYGQRQRTLGRKQYSTRYGRNTAYSDRRRDRRLSNGGSHTAQEWREKCELFGWCCAYCGESKPLVRDHKVPLYLGGTDDIMNILPACRSCNSRKGSRLTDREFITLGRAA